MIKVKNSKSWNFLIYLYELHFYFFFTCIYYAEVTTSILVKVLIKRVPPANMNTR